MHDYSVAFALFEYTIILGTIIIGLLIVIRFFMAEELHLEFFA